MKKMLKEVPIAYEIEATLSGLHCDVVFLHLYEVFPASIRIRSSST